MAPALAAQARAQVRGCALGWACLALLWWSGQRLPQMAPWAWLGAVCLLAALPAWGLWLGFMVRKRLVQAQFAEHGWLHRWLAGGLWPACKAAALSLLLSGAALWQSYFLAPWEWALLCAGPPLQVLLAGGLQARLGPQFALPAYAWCWGQRLARPLLVLLLGGAWLGGWVQGGLQDRALVPAMDPEALDAALAAIASAPSGLVRWGLDALLALQVGGGAAAALPESTGGRLAVLALTGPAGLLWWLGCVLQGASVPQGLLRAARPPARGAVGLRAAMATLLGVLAGLVLLQSTAALDGLARQHGSPLALQRLPECERIGERYYGLGTLEAARRLALQALGQARGAGGADLCAGMPDVRAALDAAVERYLDWYFSLGAEWGRIAHLLVGGSEAYLQEQLERILAEAPGLDAWMRAVQQHAAHGQAALDEGRRRIDEVLARHHLALDGGRCRVRAEVPSVPALGLLGDARQRLTASAVAGVGAGAFAAAVAGKAMGKASMKAAGKVLAKAAAKQALGKAGAAGAGALAGAAAGSVLPGAGTAVGAAVGAVTGLVAGVAIDWAALRAEEALTREDMRAQLHEALAGQWAAVAGAVGCAGAGAGSAP